MTNVERMTKPESRTLNSGQVRYSGFVILPSFVIRDLLFFRHSSFVIRHCHPSRLMQLRTRYTGCRWQAAPLLITISKSERRSLKGTFVERL
jgi:hypothetical protein